MGYYTRYDVSLEPENASALAEVVEACGVMSAAGDSSDSTKWYDHEKEMIEISKRYPNVLFTLHGEGEEAGDF